MAPLTEEFALVRDGTQVRIRPYSPDDRAAVASFFGKLSPQSRMLRFHSAGINPDTAAAVALGGRVLLALDGDRLVGLASYQRLRDPRRAEMAIAVADADQGRGIGTVLFERLARDARAEGVRQFLALVLSHNTGMLEMLRGLGFEIAQQFDRGEIEVSVDLAEDRAYQESADQRLHVATRASLEPIFQPRSVAVIGASRRRGTIGHELFRNLLNGGFPGPVYPVNPTTNAVASVRTYPSVKAIPEKVDLAIIVVPAPAVMDAAKDALDAGVRGLVVISAGFAEVSEEGRQVQNQLRDLCRSRGVRLIGPNCMGVLSNMPGGSMNGTFLPSLPPVGSVAMASQSGALGIAVLNQARQLGIGISSFVSMGNKADVSGNDLLEWWEEDPTTKVVVLYLESFGNPRRFGRVAKRVSARKPMIVIKSGRSDSGRRAAASHTAALAGSDIAVDALFKQAGVLRVESLQELFEVTTLFANQPLPRGGRVGVITNAGGLGILCADACEANGLRLPPLSEQTRQTLRAMLPAEASVMNPVDMLASAPPKTYGEVLKLVHNDPNVDAVIVLFVPPLVTSAEDVAAALGPAIDPALGKPVLACFVGMDRAPDVKNGDFTVPTYSFPESTARALSQAATYAAWLRRPAGDIPALPDVQTDVARAVVDAALQRDERPWLTPAEIATIFGAYGIARPREIVAHTAAEAAQAFRSLGGGSVAVKLVSETITHKTDVGGVRLGIDTPEGASEAFRLIEDAILARGYTREAMQGVVLQPMITGGVECLVGVVTDPLFGPLIAFGSGGVSAEVMGDVRFSLHPLTDVDADELIASTRVAKLMGGFRGAPPADVPALRDLLLRVSRLVEDVPEVAEMDLNPVVARAEGQGVFALDARIRLQRSQPR